MAALVLIIHGLAVVGLAKLPIGSMPADNAPLPVVEAILLPPPPPPLPSEPPLARPQPVTKPARPAAPVQAQTPEEPAPALAVSPSGETEAVAGTGGEGAASAPAASAPPAPPSPPARAPDSPRYAAPPSATLHYASYVNGVQNPDGLIRWQQDGSHYQLAVETRILWFRFAFQSSGALGEGGLVPERYEESRRGKVESTRFDPASAAIVFETRGKQAALPAGAQDRFSVFLQLVGTVRGNPQRYAAPGVTETFNVADTRDLEPMQVQYVGEEDVDTGRGSVHAKHFVRLPRHSNDRRKVEIWLAQSLGWMPVRLRQTEPDGTQIELVHRGSE